MSRESTQPCAPYEHSDDRDLNEPPDVEAIMAEVRRAAAQSEGNIQDYAGPRAGTAPDVTIGIDEKALIKRVMDRVRSLPERTEQARPAPAAPTRPPDPIAKQLGFDREREHGPIHRLLGKVRRWLFRVTKIQAEFEKMYERINADMTDLERRTGAGAIELQQWIERRTTDQGTDGATIMALRDPLLRSPERRWRVGPQELAARAPEYVPFVREAAARARDAGNRDALDVGCGEGTILALLRESGLDVVGIDPNPQRVRRCADRELSATEADLRDFLLTCPEAEFRCVLAIHVLEYVTEPEIATLIGEFKRVIAPGGRLLVEVPNVLDPPPDGVTPDMIVRACESAGFSGVFTHGLHPADPSEKLDPVDPSLPGAGQFNAVIEKLNARFCGPRDTLIVAEK